MQRKPVRRRQPGAFDPPVRDGLSAQLPAGHKTATGERAYLQAERPSVTRVVKVKEALPGSPWVMA
jgi:hypothetical protein